MKRLCLCILLCDNEVCLSIAWNEQQHEVDKSMWLYAMRTNILQVLLTFFFVKN